ncbi:nascent polypeptide-associated complex subunit alpha, muscle-specific form-like, partial [Penaeus japonicus]|uniref:nascent polypeptide-associated complex subunit alpha, muscle-specific form-like n=1 Tax=Penaeus japonicus TaxID=27405 RepID=UPI001C70E019
CRATVTLLMVVLSVTLTSAQWPQSYRQPYSPRYQPSYFRYPYYGYRYPTRQPVYQVRNTPSSSEKRHDTGQILYADIGVSSPSTTDATNTGSPETTISPTRRTTASPLTSTTTTTPATSTTTMSPIITTTADTSPLTATTASTETYTTTSPTTQPITTVTTTSSTTTIAGPTEAVTKDTSLSSTASPDPTGNATNLLSAIENVSELTVISSDKGVNEASSIMPIFQPFTMRPVHFILQHPEDEKRELTEVNNPNASTKQLNKHIQEDLQRENSDKIAPLTDVKFSISEPVKVCCDDDDDDNIKKSDHTSKESEVLVDKAPYTKVATDATEGSSSTEKPDLQKFFFSNLFGPGGFLGRPRPQYRPRPAPLPRPQQRPQQQSDVWYQHETQRKSVQQNLSAKPIENTPINTHQAAYHHPQNGQPQHYNRPHLTQPIPLHQSQTLSQRPSFTYSKPPKFPIRIPHPTIQAPSGQLLQQVSGPILGPAPGATWIPSSDISKRPDPIQLDSNLTWVPSNLPDRQDNSEALLFVDEDKSVKQIHSDKIETSAEKTSFSTIPTPVKESENEDTVLVLVKDEVKHFVPETIIPSKAESASTSHTEHNSSSSKQLESVDNNPGMFEKQVENTASATLSISENDKIFPVSTAVTALGADPQVQPETLDIQLVEDALIPRNAGDTKDEPVTDVTTDLSSANPSDTIIINPLENNSASPGRFAKLPFRQPFPSRDETQPIRVPVGSAQTFRQSPRKPPRQRPPPTGFFQFQRPPPSSAKPKPARPVQLISTSPAPPLRIPIQSPPQRSPVQPPPRRSLVQPLPLRSPVQPQLPVRPALPPPSPLFPQPKQSIPHSDPRPSAQPTPRPLVSRPPYTANINNKSDRPSQGILPQFNPASGLQFTLIKPSEISDESTNNQDILPQFDQESGLTFSGEIKANRNRSTTAQSVLEDIVQVSKPDPFRIISGPSLSNQSSDNSQPPEAQLPPSIPQEQVVLPAITVVSSVNFNRQSTTTVGGQNVSEEKQKSDIKDTAVNEETTQMTLPIMNIFDIVPVTNSPTETNTQSEVTSLPLSTSTIISMLNTTTTIPEVNTEPQPSSTTAKSFTLTFTEGNASPIDSEVTLNKHTSSQITNILAGGFQLTSSDDATEMQQQDIQNSREKEVLSLAGPGPMKPIPLDSPQQSSVDEDKTLKPGSVPIKPFQIPEVDDLEDDLHAVVSYVALLHRAVPPLNRNPTSEPSKDNNKEKEQELSRPAATPQLPVHIRPIPSGAFIPGIGLAKRPGAVPIRINNLSDLPPDAILVRRPRPPPPTLQARPGPPPSTLLKRPGPPPPALQARPGPPPPPLQARPGPPPPTLQARPGPPPPPLQARPGPPPPALQARPGPPPSITQQTNVQPVSNGQFRPGIIFTLDEAGTPLFSPLPPRPQRLPPQQSQNQALPEGQISSSGQEPGDSSLRQPASGQPSSSFETQTFVRPTQELDSEIPKKNDNSQSSSMTQQTPEPKPLSPEIPELLSLARPTIRPTLQTPEILPLPTPITPDKPEILSPPVRPPPQNPDTKPVLPIPALQKPETEKNPEIRQPPQSPSFQRPESQLPQQPSPPRPEVLLPFQTNSQTSETQPPPRPFPKRPESQQPPSTPQRIESQLPPSLTLQRPESQPQRPEIKLPPHLLLQRPSNIQPQNSALQRPGILPPIRRPPVKQTQIVQRPKMPPADMMPPPRPFPGAQPRPESPLPRPDTKPPILRPQFVPRPPTGPFFRPGVPPEGPLRRPVASQPQFQPSQPPIPLSQNKPSFQETPKPQPETEDFRPLTLLPEFSPIRENEEPQSTQFIRGDDQKLIDNILGSLPDFLKGSVKIDQTKLNAENSISISNSYGNVIYQKRGITYIDQVQ